jgi:predicted dithiol-disulfide oxidoreductase (DUF899 family)
MTTSQEQEPLHGQTLPGESDDYRRARNDLLRAELALKRQTEAVAAQRRKLPPGGEVPEDYTFEEWDPAEGRPRRVRLSELFATGKDTLAIYSFMYKPGESGALDVPCPICTSIVDGIDGAAPHITQRTNFAVSAKAPIERFSAHARARGWRAARLLSSANTSYNRDYLAETPHEEQFAMLNTFVRRDGVIRHFWCSEEWYLPPDAGQNQRQVDFMWPLWAVLDRTAEGRGTGWMPRLTYQ